MKRLLILLGLGACIAGCGGPASQTGVWQHETLYRSWDHMTFSWGGYKDVSKEDAKKSTQQQWWGKEVPAEAGK